ncbi:hypothetical protein BDA96_01G274100 [Sorghum bicolor]|uniref:Uncharacterized protein n=1 Tax=Sorghum bicolor TaxID=4558 RepID=A0A921S1J4_SORBI|nr:hypothetical protein BDA96_01G274100 [Sorghum bicolor]
MKRPTTPGRSDSSSRCTDIDGVSASRDTTLRPWADGVDAGSRVAQMGLCASASIDSASRDAPSTAAAREPSRGGPTSCTTAARPRDPNRAPGTSGQARLPTRTDRGAADTSGGAQLPWRRLSNPGWPPMKLLSMEPSESLSRVGVGLKSGVGPLGGPGSPPAPASSSSCPPTSSSPGALAASLQSWTATTRTETT